MKVFLAALALICTCVVAMAQQNTTVWFGAAFEDLTAEQAKAAGFDAPRGVRVTNLTAGSPAEAAGVEAGDILIAMDGAQIANDEGFTDLVLSKKPGMVVQLSILRAGAAKQLSVALGERPVRRADTAPQLMLDTGGHMASVVDLAITPDGRQMVSASNDKTIRIWDIASGKTLRMIRGESAPGDWGTIYAMALSPDGRTLAVAGFMSESDVQSASAIRLYDFASGKQVKLLKGHRNVVFALAFSPDSTRLISGSADKSAIIWDVVDGKQLIRLTGHTDTVQAVAFSKDGARAVTGSDDQTLRLWGVADGKLIAEMSEHKAIIERDQPGKGWRGNVQSVAFSAGDKLIASGSEDGRVLLWDGHTGAFLRQLVFMGGMVGGAQIKGVTFSPDGKQLLFASAFEGCSFYDVESGKEIWDGKLRDKVESRYFSDVKRENCNGAVAYRGDGQIAAASYNSTIHILDAATGKAVKTLKSSGATVFAAGIAKDGRSIGWGNELSHSTELPPLSYRLTLPVFGAALSAPEAVAAKTPADDSAMRRTKTFGAYAIDFKHVDKMLINPNIIEISKDGAVETQIEMSGDGGKDSVLTFTPDGQTILVARSARIEAYGLSGHHQGTFAGHLATVRDIAVSADGRLLISGSGDQTVRLWNLATRELIVSLFYGNDGEWVVWTPQGYYASSPNGDRIVGWQINKGPDQGAEYVTANQLRHKFYRPDIIERAIVLASATKAIEEDGPVRGGFRLSDLPQRLPPKLGVLTPRDGSQTSNGRAVIALALDETAGDPVNRFDVFVNDSKVTAAARREGETVSFEVPLGRGDNRVRFVARSTTDLLGEARLDIRQNGEGALDKRDTLYILAIGADKYPNLPKACGESGNGPCDLEFAGADAKTFADTVEAQMGRQHRRVVKQVLVNGAGGTLEPTRANVENALQSLLQAKDTDTVAVFIAGHGVNDARTGYKFLPSDARFGEQNALMPSSVVKWSTLEDAIQSARGRRLLFVDTCRSTNAFNPRLMKDASDDAIVAFSATNTQQDALELPTLGHGVFTNAVVKGLNGAADIAQEQEVRVFDLGAYVEREVRKLTKGLQTPDFYKKPGAENFVLVRMSPELSAMPPAKTKSVVGELAPPQGDARPVQPAEAKPVEAKPAEVTPAPVKPAETEPAEVKPVEAKPAVAKPAEAAPAEKTKPAAVKPAETKPAEVQHAAAKPADAVPAAQDAKPAAVLQISQSEEAERLKRGKAALALDDIAGARLIFEYLANHGSAAGAYQLALTYDPQYQSANPLDASGPDARLAQSWYLKAAELGHPEARKKIAAGK
jgi:WD40 repeat protein